MQFETNSLTDAVKEFIGIMKDSGLSYMYVKNDKFELELGQKNPPPAPPMMPAMPPMAMAAAPAAPHQHRRHRLLLRHLPIQARA